MVDTPGAWRLLLRTVDGPWVLVWYSVKRGYRYSICLHFATLIFVFSISPRFPPL